MSTTQTDATPTAAINLTEGILAGAAATRPGLVGRVKSFTSLVEADPCRVELTLQT